VIAVRCVGYKLSVSEVCIEKYAIVGFEVPRVPGTQRAVVAAGKICMRNLLVWATAARGKYEPAKQRSEGFCRERSSNGAREAADVNTGANTYVTHILCPTTKYY
jgi:hypothetical protein